MRAAGKAGTWRRLGAAAHASNSLAPQLYFLRSRRNGYETILRKAIWWPRSPLLAAFALNEGLLFVISLALASGVSDNASSIVWPIFAIDTAACAALFLGQRLGLFAGLAKETPLPARERSG